jgi:hypothetical protein
MERIDLGRTADEALDMLRWNWGRAYEIDREAGQRWRARRRDGLGEEITAMGPEALRDAIFRDYEVNPVARDEGT